MRTFRAVLAGVMILLVIGLSPLAGRARQARVYRVGVVHQGGTYVAAVEGLREGLRELGLEEGKQLVLDVREGQGDLRAVETAARRLEEDKVDLIWAVASSVVVAATRATQKVPIVFYAGSDPVALELIASLRKPGGRLTGIHGQATDLTAKRLELLKELLPNMRRVVTFYRRDNPSRSLNVARDAARRLKVELVERPVGSVDELRSALQALRPGEVDAFFYVGDAMVFSQAAAIIETAKAKKLPTMFQDQGTGGALASYGLDFFTIGRLSAKLVHRVLMGAVPGDLPVEQLDRFHFVIDLRIARALGVTIPKSALARADRILE